MTEYISKSDAVFAACKVLDTFGGCHMGPFCPDSGCKEVRDIINNVPAADVVKVVRCKNCSEWQTGWNPISTHKGAHFCAITGLFTDPDWFCKDGNKSEVEEDNG